LLTLLVLPVLYTLFPGKTLAAPSDRHGS